jgi:leader peptidase (prepilin peptidase)/N-methyltransferase
VTTALVFFLLGLPAALFADYLVRRFTRAEEEPDDEDDLDETERVDLPWQRGAGPDRLRLAVVATVPLLMALAGHRFDAPQALGVSALLVALVVCTATDLLRFRVPNAITYPGTLLALGLTIVMPNADPVGALAAALLGGGMFLVLAILSRGGLGLGDVKLAVLIGAALGLPAGYQALFLGVILAGAVLLLFYVTGLVGRKQAVPYAPFLAIGAAIIVLLHGAAFAPL